MNFKTADLCDRHEDRVRSGEIQILEPMLHSFGGWAQFCGEVVTLKLHEDNSLVRKTLETPGKNRVLVIDGGGSLRCALVGDQLAELAVRNHWSGILVYGCIRDTAAIAEMDVGVLALDAHPLKSIKRDTGESGTTLRFGATTFTPGHFLYADEDGVLVSPTPLIP